MAISGISGATPIQHVSAQRENPQQTKINKSTGSAVATATVNAADATKPSTSSIGSVINTKA